MGAMQALEWGILYPETVRSIVPIAGSGRTSPMAIALNALARQAIFNDPMWKKGNYKPEHPPADGFALARAVGHISFLSDASMRLKFGRRYSVRDGMFDFFGQFEVERYLEYNGRNFVDRFDTNAFLYLAKALDLYDVAWNFDGLEDALSHLQCPSLWFAFTSDWLYAPDQTEEVVTVLEKLGKDVTYHLIDSDYGHDSFLVEPEKFTPKVVEFLDGLGGESERDRGGMTGVPAFIERAAGRYGNHGPPLSAESRPAVFSSKGAGSSLSSVLRSKGSEPGRSLPEEVELIEAMLGDLEGAGQIAGTVDEKGVRRLAAGAQALAAECVAVLEADGPGHGRPRRWDCRHYRPADGKSKARQPLSCFRPEPGR
jgi:pimeloyl-ACP methyl ester carboxylesterase